MIFIIDADSCSSAQIKSRVYDGKSKKFHKFVSHLDKNRWLFLFLK
ncbi:MULTISPECIES: hypothetical protein [unclassified Fusobacterium]|nr:MULTISPECIES: hypothetical protein [unclassified Fusobacterium]